MSNPLSSHVIVGDVGLLEIGLLVAAPFVGSFLSVVVARVGAPATILWGRSRCAACGEPLGFMDLMPLLSWLAARGRCRHCGARIGALYPAMELGAVAVAVCSMAVVASPFVWISDLLGWTLLALALIDARDYVLPDFLTLPLVAAGILANTAFDRAMVLPAAIGAVAGWLVIFVIRQAYWWLRRREGIGLGDAKLLAAAGAWVTWEGLPTVVVLAALCGLGIAWLRYFRHGSVAPTDRVPFGSCLCLGLWIVWLYGPLG
jgi:leader peptidase (prepilin peptidase) / N-methyltransferase